MHFSADDLSVDISTIRASLRPRTPGALCVYAAEPRPAYPALVARHLSRDGAGPRALPVRVLLSRAALLASLDAGESTLAVLPLSSAARAIGSGVRARVVSASVAPGELSYLDLAPGHDGAIAMRVVAPRAPAVLLAPLVTTRVAQARVADALTAYWRAARVTAVEPILLAAAIAEEFGFSLPTAVREASAAVAEWRLDPLVPHAEIERVLAALRVRGEVPEALGAEDLVDWRHL